MATNVWNLNVTDTFMFNGKKWIVTKDIRQRRPGIGMTSIRCCREIESGREQRFIYGVDVEPVIKGGE